MENLLEMPRVGRLIDPSAGHIGAFFRYANIRLKLPFSLGRIDFSTANNGAESHSNDHP
jgi:hypothetical protein